VKAFLLTEMIRGRTYLIYYWYIWTLTYKSIILKSGPDRPIQRDPGSSLVQ